MSEWSLEYQRFGANARARGEPFSSNPWRKPPTLPGDKDVSAEEWERRALEWSRGWNIENVLRNRMS